MPCTFHWCHFPLMLPHNWLVRTTAPVWRSRTQKIKYNWAFIFTFTLCPHRQKIGHGVNCRHQQRTSVHELERILEKYTFGLSHCITDSTVYCSETQRLILLSLFFIGGARKEKVNCEVLSHTRKSTSEIGSIFKETITRIQQVTSNNPGLCTTSESEVRAS